MPSHEIKNCERCNSQFECKPGDISNCQCAHITVTKETQQFLSSYYSDCLCVKCLEELNELVETAKGKTLPPREEQQEDVHYYFDNGYLVFTGLYHMLRGYCCKSGCRHCTYGFKLKNHSNPAS